MYHISTGLPFLNKKCKMQPYMYDVNYLIFNGEDGRYLNSKGLKQNRADFVNPFYR